MMLQQQSNRRDVLLRDVEALVSRHGSANLPAFEQVLEEVMIRSAIASSETYNDAAVKLGIGKSTMYRKMKAYGIPKRRTY